MNILHLKYAIEVARTGSITQAADNLYMGQPNLSKTIKELEDNLKITIFKRTSKGVTLTPKGEKFLEYAKKAVAQIDKMEQLRAPEDPLKQSFRAIIPCDGYILSAATRFSASLDSSSGIDVRFTEENTLKAVSLIAEEDYELGIVRYQSVHEDYFADYFASKRMKVVPICEYDRLVLMSAEHPLAEAALMIPSQLEKYTEITGIEPTAPFTPATDVKKPHAQHRADKRIAAPGCERLELISCVRGAYAFSSPVTEETLKRYDLVLKSCKGPNLGINDVLIYPEDSEPGALARRFIETVLSVRDEVTADK